jgi:hypothetical protein
VTCGAPFFPDVVCLLASLISFFELQNSVVLQAAMCVFFKMLRLLSIDRSVKLILVFWGGGYTFLSQHFLDIGNGRVSRWMCAWYSFEAFFPILLST